MKYAFIDESGAPGVATNSNDFLLVSIVLFNAKEDAEKCSAAMDGLRNKLGLKPDYEFHCSHNSAISRAGMLQIISRQKFHVITVSIKKNQIKRTATYARLSYLLAREIGQYAHEIKIKMDSNPVLHKYLRKALRESNQIRYASLKEVGSHTDNLVQLADYVVNISAKKIKNIGKLTEFYRPLAEKQLVFIDIRD